MQEWVRGHFSKRGAVLKASAGGLVEDVAQRATEDVEMFTAKLASIFSNLAKPMLEVCLLSWKLSSKMGKLQLLQCYLYFFASGYLIRKATPAFAAEMTSTIQGEEGALRKSHSR